VAGDAPRSPEGLDLDRAGAWLADALEVEHPGELSAQQLSGGRSNLTFLVRAGAREWILRRPPLGRRLPTAHSMPREHAVLRALRDSDVPVPRAIALCGDEGVIGAPFYVMERAPGRVIRDVSDMDLTPDEARACSLTLVRTLARLHQVPYAELGLTGFGRPDGYVERQVARWHDQLQRSRVRELPALDELGRRVAANVPASAHAAILHGDYRIDNVMLDAADPGRITAVLDWEMATLGDPLADLGMLLMYWGQPGETFASGVHAIMAEPGFLPREEVVDVYREQTGWALQHLDFHTAFAHFKLAVIVEGIHARHVAGDTLGDGFDGIGAIAPVLATRGLEVAP
jgi:aminoglycoside phosphotransferase (APT) family kinase protein